MRAKLFCWILQAADAQPWLSAQVTHSNPTRTSRNYTHKTSPARCSQRMSSPRWERGWNTPGCRGRSETVYQRAWEIQHLIIFLLFKVSFSLVHYFVEGRVAAAISHRQKRATCRHQAEWETDGQTASETESSGTWSQLCHVPHFQFPFSDARPKDT